MLRTIRTILMLTILCTSSGCALFVAGIDSVKQAGLTSGDREMLLNQQMKDFHSSLFAGRVDAAMNYVDEDLQSTLRPQLKKSFKTDKQTDHVIDNIDFEDSSNQATVELTMKFFRNTDYLMKEQVVTEFWKFHLGGFWRLVGYQASEPSTPGDRKSRDET